MPSRVVRDEILRSESLASVSILAAHIFHLLLNVVDDYGRTEANPRALRSLLFPVRDDVTSDQVTDALVALAEQNCVLRYAVRGRLYLWLPTWERYRGRQRRGGASRWPAPSVEDLAALVVSLECSSLDEFRGLLGLDMVPERELNDIEKRPALRELMVTVEMAWVAAQQDEGGAALGENHTESSPGIRGDSGSSPGIIESPNGVTGCRGDEVTRCKERVAPPDGEAAPAAEDLVPQEPEMPPEKTSRSKAKPPADAVQIFYDQSRVEIAKLKPSRLGTSPSNSSARSIRKILAERCPVNSPEELATAVVVGAWSYWTKTKQDLEWKKANLKFATFSRHHDTYVDQYDDDQEAEKQQRETAERREREIAEDEAEADAAESDPAAALVLLRGGGE